MLTAPAFRSIGGVTAYRDDQLWNRFYLIPSHPRVRLDDDGDPVILVAKFALSDADREANPTLPAGGGYINFDVTFALTEEEQEAAREELQAFVDEEWARLRSGSTEERALPGVAGTTEPPSVDFGTPTYTQGSVAMFAPQSELLVANRVAEGTPDLLTGNVAIFNMDLTPAGATFMERALAGGSPTDLTPIQVAYDLSFWARLPPVRIHVSADSERIYKQVRKYMDGEGVDHCTTYDYQNSEINTETASVAGLIEVQIDTGSASVDDAVIQELRAYALDLMQQLIEARFFTEEPGEGHHPDFPDGLPPELLDQERRWQRRNRNPKKYLREVFDSTSMHVELNLEQSSVVEWQIHPQATLESFFAGMDATELQRFVRVFELDDPFFNELGLEVRAFADFADPALEAVEVDLRYRGRDENGDPQEKGRTLTFTSNEAQAWSPNLIGDEREYEYRYRIKFAGRDFTDHTPWERTSRSTLNLSIPDPGRLVVTVRVGDIDFAAFVQSAQVMLAYEDAEAGIPREEETIVLDKDRREGRYERTLFDLVRRPLEVKHRFRLQSGALLEDDWQPTSSRQLVINQPFDDVMQVRLLPVGAGWSEVVQVLVELRYSDLANHFEATETFSLAESHEFRLWRLPLANPNLRDFEYRVHASYQNGDFETGDWTRARGDVTLPIEVRPPAESEIRVLADRLDFEAAPVTEVQLVHPASGREATLVFQAPAAQTWRVPVPPGAPVTYQVQVTHFPAAAEPVELASVEEDDTIVVLPPYRAPRPGRLEVSLLAQLVDFAATPLVMVDLVYHDEENGVRETRSFAFSDDVRREEWSLEVPNVNHKRYSYTITYFVAPDNTPEVGERHFQERNLLVIPPRRAGG